MTVKSRLLGVRLFPPLFSSAIEYEKEERKSNRQAELKKNNFSISLKKTRLLFQMIFLGLTKLSKGI